MKNKNLEVEKDLLLMMLARLKKDERNKKLKSEKKILSLDLFGKKILNSDLKNLKKYEDVINNLFKEDEN